MTPPTNTALRADRHRRFSAGAGMALAAALTLSARPAAAQFTQSGSAYYVNGDYRLNADYSGYDVIMGKDTAGNTVTRTTLPGLDANAVVTQSPNGTTLAGVTYHGLNTFGGAHVDYESGCSVGSVSSFDSTLDTVNGGSITFATMNDTSFMSMGGGTVSNVFGNDSSTTTIIAASQ